MQSLAGLSFFTSLGSTRQGRRVQGLDFQDLFQLPKLRTYCYLRTYFALFIWVAAWICKRGNLVGYNWSSLVINGSQLWMKDDRWMLFSWTSPRLLAEWIIQFYCGSSVVSEFLAPYYSGVRVPWVIVGKELCWMVSGDGVSSIWLEVPSGVPQCSILGALVFEVFISGLPDIVLHGNTIALFADDWKTSRVIDDASDQFCFQRDLDNLHHWSIRNAMAFNVKKCKVMRLTKNKQPLVSNYSWDNSLLEEVKEFKDLEVTTTDNFNWN